jgi:hypothetical protein
VSEPKRYDLFVEASLQAEEGGEWVKWEDYCDLKEQVERLTKAGDAMAMAYAKECLDERGGVGSTIDNFYNNIEPIKVWEAAKKGGQP